MITLLEQILGFVYTLCFAICFWPQIIKSIKSKSVEDISLPLFVISAIGYMSALAYGLMRFGFDFWLCVNYILSLISAFIMVGVYFKYKK